MTEYLPRAFARFNAGINAARVEYARTLAELEEPTGPRPAECGTPGGYRKHYRDRTEVCRPCRDAYNAACRERRAKKKETGA